MTDDLRLLGVVFGREFRAYFATPLAAVFLVVFLALAAGMTFFLGGFFDRGQADLSAFFMWLPWLFLVLLPAVAMRLWAEERRSGVIELLMTLPVRPWALVAGKFLAAWAFAGLAPILTMPLWATVAWLGRPDHGVIAGSYLGAWLMAGAFLAVSACVSALTRNQVIAFVGAALACFLLVMAGFELVLGPLTGWAPAGVIETARSLSVLGHFERLTLGVLEAPALFFFLSLIGLGLVLNTLIVDLRKAA
jgi:ABC-2 type transport system permease protein